MSAARPVWVMRPEPGNAATCARLAAMGRDAVALPLFMVEPVAWDVPAPADFDAMLLSSANAVRHAGAGLSALFALPVYAVGQATADAATGAGLRVVMVGEGGVDSVASILTRDGRTRILHLTGHHYAAMPIQAQVTTRTVYVAREVPDEAIMPALSHAPLPADVLLHSPRAARRFAQLVAGAGIDPGAFTLFALSAKVAAAAGPGWAGVHGAKTADEAALLSMLTI